MSKNHMPTLRRDPPAMYERHWMPKKLITDEAAAALYAGGRYEDDPRADVLRVDAGAGKYRLPTPEPLMSLTGCAAAIMADACPKSPYFSQGRGAPK